MLSHQHGTPLGLNHEIIDLIGLLARAIEKTSGRIHPRELCVPPHCDHCWASTRLGPNCLPCFPNLPGRLSEAILLACKKTGTPLRPRIFRSIINTGKAPTPRDSRVF